MLSQLSSSPTACRRLHSLRTVSLRTVSLRIVSVLAMALKRCTGTQEHDCKDLVSCYFELMTLLELALRKERSLSL